MPKVAGPNPAHPAVDWERTADGCVTVTCPECHASRTEPAKGVRHRIKVGRFTGLCRKDGHRRPTGPEAFPQHPAINWDSLRIREGIQFVFVTCPVCGEARELEAKAVRHQLRRGTFTGRCFRDRLIAKARATPPAPVGFDWDDREVVDEAAGTRRRSMVRIRCPECGSVRLGHPWHVARAIDDGTFTPECSFYRRTSQLSHQAKTKILQSVLLTDTSKASLEQLLREVKNTPRKEARTQVS